MDQAEGLRNIIKKNETVSFPAKEARVITVTSGKGGVGKTSVSVNLAIQLSKMGKKVIVLDADFGLANIEVMLGLRPRFNLADMMFKGKTLSDIITYGPENIGFISGGSGINELTNMTKQQVSFLNQRLYELDHIADVIIVDTGAGIGDSVLEFVASSSEVLLVATPEPTSITDAYALLKTLNRNDSFDSRNTVIKMIANQVRSDAEGEELYEKLSVVVSKFLDIRLELIGKIPYDIKMQNAIMRQEPISLGNPNCEAGRAFYNMAQRLEYRVPGADSTHKGKRQGILKIFSNVIRMKLDK